MNRVTLIGRMVKDPEIRYTADQNAVCNFVIAVDRPGKPGEDKKSDFPRCTAWGKTAENMERHAYKGQRVAVEGMLRTGSYENKNGDKVYTTEVLTNHIEYMEWRQDAPRKGVADPYEDFAEVDEELPY